MSEHPRGSQTIDSRTPAPPEIFGRRPRSRPLGLRLVRCSLPASGQLPHSRLNRLAAAAHRLRPKIDYATAHSRRATGNVSGALSQSIRYALFQLFSLPLLAGVVLSAVTTPTIGLVGMVSAAAVGIWWWRRAAGALGAVLRVRDGQIEVRTRGSRKVVARLRLADLLDVSLDTKTIERVQEGGARSQRSASSIARSARRSTLRASSLSAVTKPPYRSRSCTSLTWKRWSGSARSGSFYGRKDGYRRTSARFGAARRSPCLFCRRRTRKQALPITDISLTDAAAAHVRKGARRAP